jgi:hypothetical protein
MNVLNLRFQVQEVVRDNKFMGKEEEDESKTQA